MITIIDYGAGNLGSVKKALEFLGFSYKVVTDGKDLGSPSGVVLPGVGAFGAAMGKLERNGFIPVLTNYIKEDRPFLGICLGMQLLMESSEEAYGVKGLGIVPGTCRRFIQGKIPQIGWNQVMTRKKTKLFNGVPENSFFYFLHSYFVKEKRQEFTAGLTDYYAVFTSVFEFGNLCALQFHPEKSGEKGIQLLRNWINFYVRGNQNENN